MIVAACGANAAWNDSTESNSKCPIAIGRLGSWHAASEALLDCYPFASRTELLAHHGNVVVKIIVHVERGAVLVRVEHADLDHDLLPVRNMELGH